MLHYFVVLITNSKKLNSKDTGYFRKTVKKENNDSHKLKKVSN